MERNGKGGEREREREEAAYTPSTAPLDTGMRWNVRKEGRLEEGRKETNKKGSKEAGRKEFRIRREERRRRKEGQHYNKKWRQERKEE